MRKHVTLRHPVNDIVRLMLCEEDIGIYLFEYDTLDDGPSSADALFESWEAAETHALSSFGVKSEDWVQIPDRLPGCQQDWIAPVRVRGRESGMPEWGVFEHFVDGRWEAIGAKCK